MRHMTGVDVVKNVITLMINVQEYGVRRVEVTSPL